MSNEASIQKLVEELVRLYPDYAGNPDDTRWNKGNCVVLAIGPDGEVGGRLFGTDAAVLQKCFEVGVRKLLQSWRTGFHTGRFEELVYAGKIDEETFGVQRPEFVGWEGGVPLVSPDGRRVAAACSGFRGTSDVEIIERAAVAAGYSLVPKG